jgi:hypothetical protein
MMKMKSLLVITLVCLLVTLPNQSEAQVKDSKEITRRKQSAYDKLSKDFDEKFGSPKTSGFSNLYDCVPLAKKLSKHDNGGYARMFYAAYCECKKGVSSPQREKQLVAQMKSMKRAYNNNMSSGTPNLSTPVKTSCPEVNASGGRGNKNSSKLSREAEIRQRIQNFKTAYAIYQKALNRSRQTSRELNSLADIVNTGDPFEIGNNFNRIMNQIDNIDKTLRESINMGYVEDATTVISQYSSGNAEGALYSGLGVLGNIGVNQEAKKEVERKRQEAIDQKNTALRQAADDMINANNDALQKYLELASVVIEKDKEQYYMEMAFFHSCYGRSISKNFSYNSTSWARNPCKPVEKPTFRNYYNPLHEQHFEAALRKKELFEKYENEVLLKGAIQHLSAAIDLESDRSEYYLELGRIAYPSDMVLSSINYLSAYELNPGLFDDELKAELAGVINDAGIDAANAIESENLALIRDYIDVDLFDFIQINGENLFTYAAKTNAKESLELIFNRQIDRIENTSLKKKYIQEAIVKAAFNNSTQSLNYLLS